MIIPNCKRASQLGIVPRIITVLVFYRNPLPSNWLHIVFRFFNSSAEIENVAALRDHFGLPIEASGCYLLSQLAARLLTCVEAFIT